MKTLFRHLTIMLCLSFTAMASLNTYASLSNQTSSSLTAEDMDFSFNTKTFLLANSEESATAPSKNISSEEHESLATLKFNNNDDSPYRITLFSPQGGEDGERLWSQTKLIFAIGPAVALTIALLPEEISQWDKSGAGNLGKDWVDNVTSGPVWDNDQWYLNFIGHPYFGGVYYQVARKSGYNQWNSFTYSFLMSAFYWEYGIEAFAETPSIQDLIITPVGGWIYGEWAYHKEKEIRKRGSMVWGSEFWGSTALFFLDPIDNIGIGLNKLFGKDFIKTGSLSITPIPMNADPVMAKELDGYWGLQLQLITR